MTELNMLKKWQAKHGLVADGVLGKKTLQAMMAHYGITDKKRFIMFLAQVEHETLGYTKNRENLNYKPEGLKATFNNRKITRFSDADANKYGRTAMHPANQEMIGNIAYANRGGNGTVASGDGWRYRGGGALHTTFKDNWLYYFAKVGLPADTDPAYIMDDPDHFFETGLVWMEQNNGWQYCDDISKAGVKKLGNLINAGDANRQADPNGFDSRCECTRRLVGALA